MSAAGNDAGEFVGCPTFAFDNSQRHSFSFPIRAPNACGPGTTSRPSASTKPTRCRVDASGGRPSRLRPSRSARYGTFRRERASRIRAIIRRWSNAERDFDLARLDAKGQRPALGAPWPCSPRRGPHTTGCAGWTRDDRACRPAVQGEYARTGAARGAMRPFEERCRASRREWSAGHLTTCEVRGDHVREVVRVG